MGKIEASFGSWVRSLDPSQRKTTTEWQGTFLAAVMGFSGMAVAGLVPGPRDFFSLRFVPASLCFLPVLTLAFYMGWLEKHEKISLYTFGWMSLAGATLFQTYMWSLVAFSSLPGATVMAAFPILLASFHGHLYQSSFRRPFPLVASVIAIVSGLALNADTAHLDIMIIAAPMALGTNLLLGSFAIRDYAKRKEQVALREAVDAQILHDRTSAIERISETLNELRGYNHDAGNALSGLLVMIPQFVSIAHSGKLSAGQLREGAEIALSLEKNLNCLQTILEESRQISLQNGPGAIQIVPASVIQDALGEARRQFPGIRFIDRISGELARLSIPFFGGEVALRRVFQNILLNACQGRGKEKSTEIAVEMFLSLPLNRIEISVSDNGPGFSAVQLSTPISGFQTTKINGTGLGLYTALRVLKANKGGLIRLNRGDAQGAVVKITLNLESLAE